MIAGAKKPKSAKSAAAPVPQASPTWSAAARQARLHFVTGKGGTGKTTVAAALALALARGGSRVLLVEVEERQGIAQLFDLPPLPYAERRIALAAGGGEVRALAIDVEAALLEYFAMFYNLGFAGRTLKRMGAVEFATTLAPGLRDVLITGKVKETVTRTGPDGHRVYDAVVVDSPPTGRVVSFLNVTVAMADLARRGPIRHQAEGVVELLHSTAACVHLVTLLEDMPVTETVQAIGDLRDSDLPIGSIIVNQSTTPRMPWADVPTVARGNVNRTDLAAGLRAAGLDPRKPLVSELAQMLSGHAERLLAEESCRAELVATGLPILTLPRLVDGVDLGGVYELADLLVEQDVG